MRTLAVIAVLALAANLAIIAELDFGGLSELSLSAAGELAGSVTGMLSEVFTSDSLVLGVAALLGFLWVFRRISRSKPRTQGLTGLRWLGRLLGSDRCSFPGCRRRLRIRWSQSHGVRRYCRKHAYFRLESSSNWATGDHGCDQFYVYILKLDGKPRMYVGQTRDLLRRVREHRDGKTKSTAGKRPELVWYCVVGSRSEAVQYEQQFKLYCENGIRRFVEGEYAWGNREAFMIGYVRDGSSIRPTLTDALLRAAHLKPRRYLLKALPVSAGSGSLDLAYSRHRRTFVYNGNQPPAGPGPITVWHLWLQ